LDLDFDLGIYEKWFFGKAKINFPESFLFAFDLVVFILFSGDVVDR